MAALRECREEIDLEAKHCQILGTLDTYVTRTGFSITPVVAWLTPPFELTPDPGEVAHIFEVPLAFFMDTNNHLRHEREWHGKTRYFYAMSYQDHYIWGATAGMLINLFQCLEQAYIDATLAT